MDAGPEPLAGRYRLEEVIGRGGMSTVYRGTDSVLERTVAVKILLAGLADEDPAYVARFHREARAAAALRNPAVVAVYDVGTDDETRFIVMEYVAGRSLAALLKDGRPLPLDHALQIGEQVANALGAAHAAGIVHRDIKPANVMIADDGTVKVLDFGVARMLDGTTITQTASVLGTAAYMAPERAMGEPGDARSDIYSLGCLVYAMLTGRPPFAGELAAALLHQQVNARPRPVRELRPGVPPALDALVLEMLAKSPADRPQGAHEVGRGLASPLDPTAPTVRLARARPPADRRPALAAALATAAVLLIAVLLLASGGGSAHRARSNTPETRAATTRTPTPTTAVPVTPTPAAPTQPPPSAAGPPGEDEGPPPGHDDKHHDHGDKHHDHGGGNDNGKPKDHGD
jgi:serine/threonine-protein kinase